MNEIGRLALRKEGNLWNAYWSRIGTMEGATLLASVNLELVKSKNRQNDWRLLIQEMFGDIIEEHSGSRPTWPEPKTAPERSGNA